MNKQGIIRRFQCRQITMRQYHTFRKKRGTKKKSWNNGWSQLNRQVAHWQRGLSDYFWWFHRKNSPNFSFINRVDESISSLNLISLFVDNVRLVNINCNSADRQPEDVFLLKSGVETDRRTDRGVLIQSGLLIRLESNG